VYRTLALDLNEKKTRIVKLSQGVEFLKGKYALLASGRILKLPGRNSALRMHRKLRKFRARAGV